MIRSTACVSAAYFAYPSRPPSLSSNLKSSRTESIHLSTAALKSLSLDKVLLPAIRDCNTLLCCAKSARHPVSDDEDEDDP